MSRAAVYDATGGPEVLRVAEVPDAAPGPGEVAIRVRAAGLNPVDSKIRGGFIPSDTPFPRRIGSDVAGTVEAVGDGAVYADGAPIAISDEVLEAATGSIAEHAIASTNRLTKRPEALPVEVAGGLNIAGLTAVSLLATVSVNETDTVLVGGATGAVGLVAAQLARAAGARVIGTAGLRNHDLLRSLRIEPVEYGPGLTERVRALGTPTAVYDCHGRETLDAGVELGVPRDRIAGIAGYAAIEELGVLNVERAARTPANLARIAGDLAGGRIVLPVAATHPLDEVRAAFEELDGGHAPGKVVVLP